MGNTKIGVKGEEGAGFKSRKQPMISKKINIRGSTERAREEASSVQSVSLALLRLRFLIGR